MTALPRGTVTLLFTDIEGSTRLLQEVGRERYVQALETHRRLLRRVFAAHGGTEVEMQGDSFHFAFRHAPDAVLAATTAQQELSQHQWEGAPIRVRIGIHTGEPLVSDGLYAGLDVHRAARVMSAAHGGQILVSQTTRETMRDDLPATLELRPLGHHLLKDLSSPEPLYQIVAEGLCETFPPLRARPQLNLPVPPGPLLGRERERDSIAALLKRDDVRLVTLTGAGGIGKTRLGLQAAADAAGDFDAGTFWADLAGLRASDLVVGTVARALGAPDEVGPHIGDKRVLLLVDNFEHVLDAAPAMGRLLGECPNLKLLITSREPLHLRGEWEYRVEPLRDVDAALLFEQHARSVGADVSVSSEIREICRRLDHMPLAIELAAARVRLLSPSELLERLEQRLPLLVGGPRDLPERQRTLQAAIEWSYELLTPEEQHLFRKLSIFAGGWTLEAAEQICQASLDGLQSLVEKSLVRRRDTRYSMLETFREYAAGRLARANERAPTSVRHAAYFAEFVRSQGTGLRRSEAGAIRRLESDLDNVRAALAWSLDGGEASHAAVIIGWGWPFWCDRALLDEGAALARRVPPLTEQLVGPEKIECLYGASQILRSAGERELARELSQRAIAVMKDMGGHESRIARSVSDLAWMAVEDHDFETARTLADEALSLRRTTEDGQIVGEAEHNEIEAAILFSEGRFADARGLYEEVAVVQQQFERLGDLAGTRLMIGQCHRRMGNVDRAAELIRIALAFFVDVDARMVIPECLQEIAALALARGEASTAALLLGASEQYRRELGTPLWDPADWERMVAAVRADLGEAASVDAWREGAKLDLTQAVQLALRTCGAGS